MHQITDVRDEKIRSNKMINSPPDKGSTVLYSPCIQAVFKSSNQ